MLHCDDDDDDDGHGHGHGHGYGDTASSRTQPAALAMRRESLSPCAFGKKKVDPQNRPK
ncbi:hypothetical protein K504DRAFT_459542 [Pleomassaria siparia CBS 279.74]|uniref:Uncharacterized protein n=1 Tax=Pleomassaria siparia CBS 279.74 TaxID=1314801 RepID=A0A6G1K1G6_9PLEO|nr:hypothetical protein K504DRAFT_459542 [Pleomassaria siparia CBS 279.74]